MQAVSLALGGSGPALVIGPGDLGLQVSTFTQQESQRGEREREREREREGERERERELGV